MEIDVSLLKPCALQELEYGELFIPIGEGQRFLVGRVKVGDGSNDKLLMCLDGDPFDIGLPSYWDRPPGMKLGNLRFIVDLDSAVPADCSVEFNGALVRRSDGLSIISARSDQAYTVALEDGDAQTLSTPTVVAFTRWKIVVGDPEKEVTLFEQATSE